ncbi:MAG TPA: Na+/H+ antiporter NhaA [Caulobacteraceae bacterium]|jgi:NhaA family Na+:H+ antiporter|nr:Na+/H+ antiporter NhaA [Caulobacteraceae bacterium]
MRRPTLSYLRTEAGAGLVLPVAAVAAIGLATSGYSAHYKDLIETAIPARVGGFAATSSLAGWVRALLMPIFFLVLGMELKFELLRGELSNPRRLALPALAALGGFVVPALVAWAIGPASGESWLSATTTDGAAALAALSLVAPRLSPSLRVLLIAVAIADNLAAVVIAAVLTAAPPDWQMLAGAGAVLAVLALLSRWRRAPFLFYAAGFVLVWGFTLKSGLDPALAGVASAVTVPIGARRPGQDSTLRYFMDSLHPYVAFGVLPLFVFTAAGFSLHHFHLRDLAHPAPIALIAGLALGKPAGVLGACAAGVALKTARRPTGTTWRELIGVACFTGVGFTLSYFIAGMGGADPPAPVRAAILIGSIAPALAGGWLLGRASPEPELA